MSSLRNTVNRRVHRERDQLADRKNRYGLLEKHKDYKLRAKDHNRKKEQLKSLRKKAEDRNEDEFYFGMLSRKGPETALSSGSKKWDGTVAGDRGNKTLSRDVVRLLKTQDMAYIRSVRNIAMKEVKALEERVIALGGDIDNLAAEEQRADDDDDDDIDLDFDFNEEMGAPKKKKKTPAKKNKKIVFAEAVDEREDQIRQVTKGDTPSDDGDSVESGENKNKDKKEDGDKAKSEKDLTRAKILEGRQAKQKRLFLEKLQRRLLGAKKKQSTLAKAEQELHVQRLRMAKTATLGGVTKAGKRFKIRQRKR